MIVRITKNGQEQVITLPTKMLLNKFVIRLAFKNHRTGLNGISRRDSEILLTELERFRQRHGSWDLVEVESADGETVIITL
mgnify:CR=1 FL=1